MNTLITFGWRRAIALGLVSTSVAGPAIAGEPVPVPEPAPVQVAVPMPVVRTASDVEIYHGTVKISPSPRPVFIPVPSQSSVRPPAIREDVRVEHPPTTPSAVGVRDQPYQSSEPRTIILTTYAFPPTQPGLIPANAPWLGSPGLSPATVTPPPTLPPAPLPTQAPSPPSAQPMQPTVVVIRDREPGTERQPIVASAPEPTRGLTVGVDTLLGIGIGVAGLGFGFAGWRRRSAAKPRLAPPAPADQPPDGSILLMGKYNAGLPREKPERFDVGPSYEAEVREKKKAENDSKEAVLEFILSQNLALHAEFAGLGDDSLLPEAIELRTDPIDGSAESAAE